MSDSSWPHGLQPTHPWDFPGKSTGVGCHGLLWSVILHCFIYLLSNIFNNKDTWGYNLKKKIIIKLIIMVNWRNPWEIFEWTSWLNSDSEKQPEKRRKWLRPANVKKKKKANRCTSLHLCDFISSWRSLLIFFVTRFHWKYWEVGLWESVNMGCFRCFALPDRPGPRTSSGKDLHIMHSVSAFYFALDFS